MYNVSRKQNYIQVLKKSMTKSAYRQMDEQILVLSEKTFDILASDEVQANKDLCDMTNEELIKLIPKVANEIDIEQFNLLCGNSEEEKQRAVALAMYLYERWCFKSKLSDQDNVRRRPPTSTVVFTEAAAMLWIVRSPEHLQSILDEHFAPAEEYTADCCARGIIWLAYMGLSIDEICSLTRKHLDFVSNIVKVERDGQMFEIPIYEHAVSSLHAMATTDNFVVETAVGSGSRYLVPRKDSPYIVRGVTSGRKSSTEFLSTDRERRRLVFRPFSDWGNPHGFSLSYSGTVKSGAFYRAYQAELVGDMRKAKKIIQSVRGPTGLRLSQTQSYVTTREYNTWKTLSVLGSASR